MRLPAMNPGIRSGALALTTGAAVLIIPAIMLSGPTAPKAQAASPAQVVVAQPAIQAAKGAQQRTATDLPLVNAQILAINDFHGHLEPEAMSISAKTGDDHGPGYVPAGGAAYLATKLRAAKKANPASVVVSGGDLIGASPMISGYYHDESTFEAMNKIIDVGTVGNHEFDEGTAELHRMVSGGCHAVDGCQDGTGYDGAAFDVLAANVIDRSTGEPIFPAYTIKDVGGAKIAFIGVVTTDTAAIVPADGIADVRFADVAATVNALVPTVKAAGADAIVVLMHEGAAQSKGGINECKGLAGPALTIVKKLSADVDAVVSAHTHKAYNCLVKGKLLTSAASNGRVFSTIKLTIDPNTHQVTKMSAKNVIVDHLVTPDADVAALISRYHKLIAPIAGKKVGSLTTTGDRTRTAAGESRLGDLIADAQLAATKAKAKGAGQLAIVTRGGLRADLLKGTVTYGEVYSTQPFGRRLVTLTLTGKQLDAVLENQFCNALATTNDKRVPLDVSTGFSYKFDPKLACGKKIRLADVKLHGKAIKSASTYRVTVDGYLAGGGDGISGLTKGTARKSGGLDRDALASYLTAHAKLTLPARNRIGRR